MEKRWKILLITSVGLFMASLDKLHLLVNKGLTGCGLPAKSAGTKRGDDRGNDAGL